MMSKVKIRIQRKKQMTVLNNASLHYYELINMYNEKYEQVFESKDENWRRKHYYKNQKKFSYQEDKTEKEEDKADQELPSWIKSKDEFNELKDHLLGLEKYIGN